MNLSPMRFKSFIWPHNPKVYSITYERKMAVNKIPFGRHYLQSLGQTRRIFRGEGEFVGEGAYDSFKELASLFYQETPGPLIHPVWMAVTAWFVGLKLEQEPRSDYVRYSFEFWEVLQLADPELTVRETEKTEAGQQSGEKTEVSTQVWHTVVQGDSLWAIARYYGTTVDAILTLNPSIENPNLIITGQKVRVA